MCRVDSKPKQHRLKPGTIYRQQLNEHF